MSNKNQRVGYLTTTDLQTKLSSIDSLEHLMNSYSYCNILQAVENWIDLNTLLLNNNHL